MLIWNPYWNDSLVRKTIAFKVNLEEQGIWELFESWSCELDDLVQPVGSNINDPPVGHQDYLNGYFMKHIDRIRKTKIILHISSDSGPSISVVCNLVEVRLALVLGFSPKFWVQSQRHNFSDQYAITILDILVRILLFF